MIKYRDIVLILMLSSSSFIYSGFVVSKLMQGQRVEEQLIVNSFAGVEKEFNSFFQAMDVKSCTSREALKEKVVRSFEQNLYDPKQFPLFHKLMSNVTYRYTLDLQKQFEEGVMEKVVITFVDSTCREKSLPIK